MYTTTQRNSRDHLHQRKIYTVNESQPWAEAIAIKDGKFLKVGSTADVEDLKGDHTTVVSLEGKLILPGLGEGIIPSMICADIFLRNINDWEQYRKEVLEYFEIYKKVFKFIHSKMMEKFSFVRQFPDLFSIYRYMKKNDERFGMEIHMRDLMKIAKA